MRAKHLLSIGLLAFALTSSVAGASKAAPRETGRIAFARGGSIWTIHAGGNGAKRLTNSSTDTTPVWSRDGKRIAFIRQEPEGWGRGELWTMEADGRNERRLVREKCWAPLWSPVADELVFARYGNNTEKDGCYLAFINSEGRQTRKPYLHHVTVPLHGTQTYQVCDWSLDGKRVSVSNFGYLFVEIEELRFGADRVLRKKLFPRNDDRKHPSSYVFHKWNPTVDDRFLLIRRRDRDATELTVGGTDEDLRPLVKLKRDPIAFFAARADWSPSGKQIVYEDVGKIFTLEVDDAKPKYLTDGYCPAWAP